jgi:hypothetical protein
LQKLNQYDEHITHLLVLGIIITKEKNGMVGKIDTEIIN